MSKKTGNARIDMQLAVQEFQDLKDKVMQKYGSATLVDVFVEADVIVHEEERPDITKHHPAVIKYDEIEEGFDLYYNSQAPEDKLKEGLMRIMSQFITDKEVLMEAGEFPAPRKP